MAVKKPTVSIGIPAFNEAANITQLISTLFDQSQSTYRLDQIIVASDASTDNTTDLVKRIANNKIKLIDGRIRIGQAKRQNQIFDSCSSDIVVLLNADVLPKGKKFIQHIIAPILSDSKVGLVGAKVIPTTASSSFGQMLDWQTEWKNNLYEQINNGDSIYLCHGRARAFSKALYTELRWPQAWSEDAFSYLRTKELGFSFVYAKRAQVWFQSPETLADHTKQSVRFFNNTVALYEQFSKEYVNESLRIPVELFGAHLLRGLKHNPVNMLWYLTVIAYCKIAQHFPTILKFQMKHNWEPSISTKTLNI